MLTQLLPPPLQRSHWYAYERGELLHVPSPAVSVCPTVAVPLIVGGAVLTGAASTDAWPAPTAAPVRANTSTAISAAGPLADLFIGFVLLGIHETQRGAVSGLDQRGYPWSNARTEDPDTADGRGTASDHRARVGPWRPQQSRGNLNRIYHHGPIRFPASADKGERGDRNM